MVLKHKHKINAFRKTTNLIEQQTHNSSPQMLAAIPGKFFLAVEPLYEAIMPCHTNPRTILYYATLHQCTIALHSPHNGAMPRPCTPSPLPHTLHHQGHEHPHLLWDSILRNPHQKEPLTVTSYNFIQSSYWYIKTHSYPQQGERFLL